MGAYNLCVGQRYRRPHDLNQGKHFAFARQVTSSISTNARKIVFAAQNVIGNSYDEEGYGPYFFCPAGLVYHCLNNSGLYVDRLTCAEYAQLTGYKRIEDRAQLREGDIVFFYDGHGSNRAIRNAGICISEKDMITVGKDSDVHIQTLTNTWAEKNFAHGLRF